MGRGNGYDWPKGMSVNAVSAYSLGEMPLSKWTRSDILGAIWEYGATDYCDIELADLKKFYSKWKKDQLEHLLVSAGWHHTSSAYNETMFYRVAEEKVDHYFNCSEIPEHRQKKKVDFEEGWVHGEYKVAAYHPYSRWRKYSEEWIPFENGRVKGDWLYLGSKRVKKMTNVKIEKVTKNKRRKKH